MNNEDGFLEELLALRRIEEAWENNHSPPLSSDINAFFSSTSWGTFDVLDSSLQPPPPPQTTPILPNFPDQFYSSSCFPMLEEAYHVPTTCKPEPAVSGESMPATMFTTEGKSGGKVKKIGGQPSKNLMAERRRRKRLNDRLSMLRSVVPKISKMDRTSILGDTIEYMKELLERINSLQDEIEEVGSNQLNVMSIFKDNNNNNNNDKPNDVLLRNSPKFDVERKNMDTRVEICCGGKPGLLLSTVTTLEALGLEIQQCVISCFNDFSLQASCSEEMDQRKLISSEDIKQELFRNAGYGGRCL